MHENHRLRLRRRYEATGLDSFEDHTILELLLFSSIPRKDTNPIAHLLLERFGSLRGVFAATEEELLSVKGVGIATARMLTDTAEQMLARLLQDCVISLAGTDESQRNRLAVAAHWFLWPYDEGMAVLLAYNEEGKAEAAFSYESTGGPADNLWELIETDLRESQAKGGALVFCGGDETTENIRQALAKRVPLLFRFSVATLERIE